MSLRCGTLKNHLSKLEDQTVLTWSKDVCHSSHIWTYHQGPRLANSLWVGIWTPKFGRPGYIKFIYYVYSKCDSTILYICILDFGYVGSAMNLHFSPGSGKNTARIFHDSMISELQTILTTKSKTTPRPQRTRISDVIYLQ